MVRDYAKTADRLNPVRFLYAFLASGVATGLIVIWFADPRVPGNFPICPFYGFTGWHCPGCGTLRALYSLLHGDASAALGYNLLAVLCLPFVAYSFLAGSFAAFGLPRPPSLYIPSKWIWGLIVGIVCFWVIRNLPMQPISVLAP